MKGYFWLPLFLFFCLSSGEGLASEDMPSIFQKANAEYRGADYVQAGSLYESLIAKGAKDANVYYNLGNVYFKQNRTGVAVLNYERALRLHPRDRDIRANLAYVKGLLEYRIEDKRNWYLKTLENLLGIFTFEEMGIVSLTLGLSFWMSWLVILFLRPDGVWGWKIKTLMMIALMAFSLWLFKGVQAQTIQEAVVLKSQASVRYGPSYKDQIAFKLGEGMKVRVKKTEGEWSRVILVNGETGWMAQEEIGVI